jgi:small multidrug resistance pump
MNTVLYAWLILVASILFEAVGMIFLRYANGFANLLPSVAGVGCFLLSIWTFSIALKHIEMGITYAVWAAASTAIVAAIGIAFYAESASTFKVIGVALIIVGVALLNLSTKP